jgi:hypothetical protein
MIATATTGKLDQIIQEFNPFNDFVVKTKHVWNEDFLDIPFLHADASKTILDAVSKINASKLETIGFALVAPKGVGKTHVLTRIRQSLKQNNEGFFIYMCEYGNLSLIKHQFLQSLASSLKKVGNQGVMQWQELAAALITQAMGKPYSPQQLLQQLPLALLKKPQIIDQLRQKVEQNCPDVDNPDIIKAVLWTLSPNHASFAINWLAGRDLSEAQAKAMDLPLSTAKQDRDAESFAIARQILDLIAYYTTPVICFDELDGSETADEDDLMHGSFTRAQVVGSLAKDIFNNLKRGVLIAGMYHKTWLHEFGKQISVATAIRDRISHEITLSPTLKPDELMLLVSHRLEHFYAKHGLTPPHPVYPFDPTVLRKLGQQEPTIRDTLRWCEENFNSAQPSNLEKLKMQYQSLESAFEHDLESNERIGNALAFGFQQILGKTIDGVLVQAIERPVKAQHPSRAKHYGYLNFKIVGEENGKPVKIGVAAVQDSNGNSIGHAMRYLTQYQEFDFTRGCLIRAKTIQLTAKVAHQHLNQLLETGGEWVRLKGEEIKPLILLHDLYKSLDREQFSEEDFHEFLEQTHSISKNPLICEILSDPSGQAPAELIDEDKELEQLLLIDSEVAPECDLSAELEAFSIA